MNRRCQHPKESFTTNLHDSQRVLDSGLLHDSGIARMVPCAMYYQSFLGNSSPPSFRIFATWWLAFSFLGDLLFAFIFGAHVLLVFHLDLFSVSMFYLNTLLFWLILVSRCNTHVVIAFLDASPNLFDHYMWSEEHGLHNDDVLVSSPLFWPLMHNSRDLPKKCLIFNLKGLIRDSCLGWCVGLRRPLKGVYLEFETL